MTMLQVRIEDVQLEERIKAQARRAGQTPEEFIWKVVVAAVPETEYPRLNPHRHGKIMAFDVFESDELNEVEPFADVTDTADFVQKLRQQAWR